MFVPKYKGKSRCLLIATLVLSPESAECDLLVQLHTVDCRLQSQLRTALWRSRSEGRVPSYRVELRVTHSTKFRFTFRAHSSAADYSTLNHFFYLLVIYLHFHLCPIDYFHNALSSRCFHESWKFRRFFNLLLMHVWWLICLTTSWPCCAPRNALTACLLSFMFRRTIR